jgi:uncharacterized repeat protein (TIGR03803 family)
VFEIASSGKLTTLHSFDFTTDGAEHLGALVQDTNGDFYGTTYQGDTTGHGTTFKITPGGTLTTLANFKSDVGAYPEGALCQAENSTLYGTTFNGGEYGDGAIFEEEREAVSPLWSFSSTGGFEPTSGVRPSPIPTAHTPTTDWCKAPTGAFMGPRRRAAPTASARCSMCPWD